MKNRFATTVLVATGLLLFGSLALLKTEGYYGNLLRGWDAQFYYAQARSIAFDRSLDLTESLNHTPYKAPFVPDETGRLTAPPREGERIVNKYPIGLSLIEIPWMLLGELTSRQNAGSTPGYSASAIRTVGWGLLTISVAGLVLLHRMLTERYGFWPALGGVVATWFGGSLFFYSAIFPFMAHGVAFTIVVAILWQIERLRQLEHPCLRSFVWMGCSFGVLFLVRPQQALLLVVAAPVLIRVLVASGRPIRHGAAALLMLGLLVGLQCLLNLAQVGTLTLNAYAAGNEGFDWLHPNWTMVLTSAPRGLLWMHPIVLLAVPALVLKHERSASESIALAHGMVQVYLIACWSSPEQGDSFGSRMWIESTPVIAMGIASLLARAEKWTRGISGVMTLGCLGWTTFLMLAYILGHVTFDTTHAELLNRLRTLHP